MRLPRACGIICHISSLPGRFGIGDLGPAAYRFVDFLERSGQGWWQVLPVGPTGYGSSPYQSLSSFAGNAQFVSLERLEGENWLQSDDLRAPDFSTSSTEFDRVAAWRRERLLNAFRRFAETSLKNFRQDWDDFRARNAHWLEDYALFIALKEENQDQPWTKWAPELIHRHPDALVRAKDRLARQIEAEIFIQFQFERQWSDLKQYAAERNVQIIGDVPIFVAHDSADVWANQSLFSLDSEGNTIVKAGVPPDYFSSTGQLWGNPLYKWAVHAERGYDWWIARLRHAFQMFDLVRLDHFRGFEAYWEIPGGDDTAINGRWVPGPGMALFNAAEHALGKLPLIAEDLGIITPEVDALREELGAPGMRVLQFAFGDDDKASEYRPHNYKKNSVVYTGTHDNDTTVGWFHSEAGEGTTRDQEQIERERRHVLAYIGGDGRDIHWDMIRLAWESVADTAIAPLQDVLGLGSDARMNLPGTVGGNWRWRFTADQITPEIETRLKDLTEIAERRRIVGPS